MKVSRLIFLLSVSIPSWSLYAGHAAIVDVDANLMSNGLYRFDVTVAHQDEGWEHYVDKWDVLAPDGSILGSRTLVSPNDKASTLTRSLVGVKVPDGIGKVTFSAHDTLHGDSGNHFTVTLPQ